MHYTSLGVGEISKDAWVFGRSTNAGTSYADAIIDFDQDGLSGSNITESAGTVTVATAGLYWIQAQMQMHGGSNDFFLQKNTGGGMGNIAADEGGRYYDSGATLYHMVTKSVIVQLGATNSVAVNGDTVNVYGTGLSSTFIGFRIGGNE
jgi:hypothetical protein